MEKKIKILTLSDHPLSPSGVAHQTKAMIQGLLDKHPGKFSFFCLGGAIRHEKYEMITVDPEEYGEDWKILPVDGYGNEEQLRSFLRTEKPDIVWFMTDPRFWGWLWNMEDEIRATCPLVYYHVWDNHPAPKFNAKWYEGCDLIATISKVTDAIVNEVVPDGNTVYVPHAVDDKIFRKLEDDNELLQNWKDSFFERFPQHKGKFMFFWNNRNARRKQSGTLVHWFSKYLEKYGKDSAFMVMHTEPRDPHGQPLDYLIEEFGMAEDANIILSTVKVSPEELAVFYNVADCTINIADAEGFGLATLESLSCETPIIVNMTGGLQEQVTNGEEWFGIGIEPSSSSLIGSLDVPYIYEDRINENDFVESLNKMVTMSDSERKAMATSGKRHVQNNYNFDKYLNQWNEILTEVNETGGSWDTRKNYSSWNLEEIK